MWAIHYSQVLKAQMKDGKTRYENYDEAVVCLTGINDYYGNLYHFHMS